MSTVKIRSSGSSFFGDSPSGSSFFGDSLFTSFEGSVLTVLFSRYFGIVFIFHRQFELFSLLEFLSLFWLPLTIFLLRNFDLCPVSCAPTYSFVNLRILFLYIQNSNYVIFISTLTTFFQSIDRFILHINYFSLCYPVLCFSIAPIIMLGFCYCVVITADQLEHQRKTVQMIHFTSTLHHFPFGDASRQKENCLLFHLARAKRVNGWMPV